MAAKTPFDYLVPVPVHNVFGSDIPPFSLVKATAGTTVANGIVHYDVTQQDGTLGLLYFVTGPGIIKTANPWGVAYARGDVVFQTAGSTASYQNGFGPKYNSFAFDRGSPSLALWASWQNQTKKFARGAFDGRVRGVIGAPTSDLPALSGTTAGDSGAGGVTLYTMNGATLATTPITFQAYNLGAVISANTITQFVEFNGALVALAGSGGATIYKALINMAGNLASATATATIDTVTTLGGTSVTSPPTSATNFLKWAGKDNDPCLILATGSGAYLLLAVGWDVITSVTDSLIDAPNRKLQKKTTDLIGKGNAAQSAATDIDAGATC